MTSRTTSSANLFSREEDEEMRFLRKLKGELREQAVAVQEANYLNQERLAEHLGYDPAQLSRMLSFDRHVSSLTLFKLMYRLGRRWILRSEKIPDPQVKIISPVSSHVSSTSHSDATATVIVNQNNRINSTETISVNPNSKFAPVSEVAW